MTNIKVYYDLSLGIITLSYVYILEYIHYYLWNLQFFNNPALLECWFPVCAEIYLTTIFQELFQHGLETGI